MGYVYPFKGGLVAVKASQSRKRLDGVSADIQKLIAEAEKITQRISADRDKLRDVISKYEDICNDIDDAESDFDEGVRYFESAVDAISRSL